MAARQLGPFDPDVVAPWRLGDGRRGALLLHGFAGTPPELRRLGLHLAGRGWRCSAPALAGHASTPADLGRTRWQDWARSAAAALEDLRRDCDVVCVAGQSMGGSMALHLAAQDPSITAVAALAAPIWLRDWRLRLLPAVHHVVRWYSPDPADVDLHDTEAVTELWSYGRRPTSSIVELTRFIRAVRDELATVRAPVLLLHGGRDRTVDPRNMTDIASRLVCSAAVEQQLLPRSGHAVSVDVDRETVNARVAAWFDRWAPAEEQLAG
ncbi:MAG TPA: alpha/beta fold hydrolase [Candidatus Dormibacteraeota bacterium]|nr:alpha/beta fold hydrolase [Candidatus Dormibacteraeota bacterium]